MNFSTINTQVGIYLFRYCNLEEMICKMRTICKSFYNISYLPLSWRYLKVEIDDSMLNVYKIQQHLKSINCLEWLHYDVSYSTNTNKFLNLLKQLKYLRCISIGTAYYPDTYTILQYLNKINTLKSIQFQDGIKIEYGRSKIIDPEVSISTFDFSHFIMKNENNSKNIENLKFETLKSELNEHSLIKNQILEAINIFPNIKQLYLGYNTVRNVDVNHLTVFFQKLPNLIHFTFLDMIKNIDNKKYIPGINIIQYMPKNIKEQVVYLEFGNCKNCVQVDKQEKIVANNFEQLLSFPYLETLKLEFRSYDVSKKEEKKYSRYCFDDKYFKNETQLELSLFNCVKTIAEKKSIKHLQLSLHQHKFSKQVLDVLSTMNHIHLMEPRQYSI